MNQTSMGCVDLLENNQVDLIITNSPNTRLNTVGNVKALRSFSDVFIANRSAFPKLAEESVSLEQLLDYPILMLESHATTSEFLHKLFLDNQLDLVPSIEISSNDLLIDLAKIGLGIAFVPDYCIQENEQDLIILNLTKTLPMRQLVAAFDNQIPLANAAEEFLQLLQE